MTYYPTRDELDLLRSTVLLLDLNPDQMKQILLSARRCQIERNAFLFHQGEPAVSFYILLEGNVRLSQITPEGRQVIVHFFGPGDAMAFIAILVDEEYPVTAEATTDCKLLSWDRSTTLQLMENYPKLAVNGLQMVAKRFWELQNRYRELATERVERRVAHAVLRLVEQGDGYRDVQSPQIVALSRQDLAEMAGTTQYTVSRLCSSWEQQGILSTGREQFAVLDFEALTAIADDLS